MNALAILRVGDVMQTPRAIREDWAKTADEDFLKGAGSVPSWVKTHVTGFLVRPAASQEVWAASVVSVPETITVDSIAAQLNRPVESFSELPAVRSNRDSYVVGISSGLLGIWRPAIRQEASHWTRAIKARVTGPLSDYLLEASATKGHLVMAVDLENTLDPGNSWMYLSMVPELKNSQATREKVQALLMTLRGVTLVTMTEEKTTARLRVDFGAEVGELAGPVKSFLLSTLHDLGAAIDDFDQAEFKAEGKSLVASTELSDESVRRLVSLITASPQMNSMPEGSQATSRAESGSPGATAEASARYLRQVDRFVNDLSRASNRSNDASKTAMWHDKFASRIEELPVSGVDPVLLDYGSDVASKLRALGRSLRGQHLDVNLQQGTLTYNYDYNPGWAALNVWGGVGYGAPTVNVSSNLQQVREQQAAAISAGARQREEVWGMITESRAKALRQMQLKYGDDFAR